MKQENYDQITIKCSTFTKKNLYDILTFKMNNMNFEIIVRSNKDGGYIVVCPNYPDISGEGATVEEAIESVIERISDNVAGNIKQSMKEAMREIAKKLPENGTIPSEMSYVMTKFPICLN